MCPIGWGILAIGAVGLASGWGGGCDCSCSPCYSRPTYTANYSYCGTYDNCSSYGYYRPYYSGYYQQSGCSGYGYGY